MAAGAIDFAVFFVFLPFGLPCEDASHSIAADAAVLAGKSIMAVALFVVNQSVLLSAAVNQSIAAGAAGTSSLPFGLPCAAASQSIAAVVAGK
jgi:hypothetical protein